MGTIERLEDHKILKYQAAEEGCSYREFREKLRLHKIPLEAAIENARNGISVSQYLRRRMEEELKEKREEEKFQKRFKTVIYSAMAVSVLAFFLSFTIDKASEDTISIDTLTEYYERFGWQ
ncbi:MAG TPA: hypothetical protein VJG30_04680 [Candidatus Nanoarchaeia archaeon]|nr:hypothetical protein [Candidatus Nanoarchaeia archaeon]